MQNWYAVLSVLEHLLTYLKKHNSNRKETHLWSDNARCCYCVPCFAACQVPTSKGTTSVSLVMGRTYVIIANAPVKLRVLNYVHAGHDVLNATQLKGIIDSYGGILGTKGCVATPSLKAKDSRKMTWPGIEQFNNFEFSG